MDSKPIGRCSVIASNIESIMLVGVILLTGCHSTPTSRAAVPTAVSTAKVFNLPDEDGQRRSFAGKGPALLSFTTTWCGACQEHRQDFHDLYRSYKDKGLGFYAIRVWETAAKVREEIAAEKAPYKHLFDSQAKVSDSYQVEATPTIIVIDAAGRVIYRATVFDRAELRAELDSAIAGGRS